jgi:hypothetical protein
MRERRNGPRHALLRHRLKASLYSEKGPTMPAPNIPASPHTDSAHFTRVLGQPSHADLSHALPSFFKLPQSRRTTIFDACPREQAFGEAETGLRRKGKEWVHNILVAVDVRPRMASAAAVQKLHHIRQRVAVPRLCIFNRPARLPVRLHARMATSRRRVEQDVGAVDM